MKVAQDRVQWRALVLTVFNLLVLLPELIVSCCWIIFVKGKSYVLTISGDSNLNPSIHKERLEPAQII